MHGIPSERTLMRIHVEAHATWKDTPLYVAIVTLLRDHHFAGATVLRGLEEWSVRRHHFLHPHEAETPASDEAVLPFVIETIESADKIEAILPMLDPMIGRGVITLERAQVILYRPHAVSDNSDTASTA